MSERRLLGHLAREPLYNTRAVANATGVPVDTIRAWERRYDVPQPHRTSTNQRLYSEMDIGIINWLRERTEEGMTISQAIRRLNLEHPGLGVAQQPAPTTPTVARFDLEQLRQQIVEAAHAFDRSTIEHALDEGLARVSIESFCSQVVDPIVDGCDDDRSIDPGRLAASAFLRRVLDERLVRLVRVSSSGLARRRAVLVFHGGLDVTGRVVELRLSRQGWLVTVAGLDLPVDALVATVNLVNPELICLHAPDQAAVNLALAYARILRTHAATSRRMILCAETHAKQGRSSPDVEVVTGSPSEMAAQIQRRVG